MRPPGPLVDAPWLADHLGAADLVVADVRWSLAGSPQRGPGRHPLPAPGAFAAAMAGLGIGDDDLVVAYDDAGGAYAARLWWMLDRTGHAAAVLDGGFPAWDGPLETGEGTVRP